jgi:hypothetical protein
MSRKALNCKYLLESCHSLTMLYWKVLSKRIFPTRQALFRKDKLTADS